MADDAVAVEVADEAGNAAFEVESLLPVVYFIDKGYFQAFIEISHLPQALAYRIEIVVDLGEYFFIGEEGSRSAGALGFADYLYRRYRHAALVFLVVDLAVAPDIDGHHSERALTTEAPTPCRPPDTV